MFLDLLMCMANWQYSNALVAGQDSTWTEPLSHSEESFSSMKRLVTHPPPELKAKRHPQLAYFWPIIKCPCSYSSFNSVLYVFFWVFFLLLNGLIMILEKIFVVVIFSSLCVVGHFCNRNYIYGVQ